MMMQLLSLRRNDETDPKAVSVTSQQGQGELEWSQNVEGQALDAEAACTWSYPEEVCVVAQNRSDFKCLLRFGRVNIEKFCERRVQGSVSEIKCLEPWEASRGQVRGLNR
jgi:hypothetical protein